ncbi:RNA-guided endonuclease InsQ/TnpB family protein [Phocaeicola plebeius]|uniref:RNA-guided endonuclease InsQ/TnpB family protein n=1 Tax=Phocaeicola plebeius TaxID=310297 RepID=UPI003AF05789
MITISHKIELTPNNKQKTYFRKAFGCARLAYNWGLAEWQLRYKEGEKVDAYGLKKAFNAIKKDEYPFVLEVTKYATQQPFINLGKAFRKFFDDLKKGVVSYPQFKKKKDNEGSFYIGGDQVSLSDINCNSKTFKNVPHNEKLKRQYLRVPNLGWVKMTERLRFIGKINGVVISQQGNKYFASFSVQITEDEYKRTHPKACSDKANRKAGIDLGIKSALILSDGIAVDNPKPLKKNLRKIKRISRQLDKRTHARTKQERLEGRKKSNNYMKLSVKLSNAQRKVSNIRRDFIQKVTTILTTHYSHIALEDLNVKGMTRNHRLSQSVSDVAFGELCRQIEYKSQLNGVKILKAERFYPSSKTCSVCGSIKQDLKLSDRTYHCDKCGAVIDRDYNASLNLLSLIIKKQIGADYPESTPEDLAALFFCFARNGIATSKVETGRQRKL